VIERTGLAVAVLLAGHMGHMFTQDGPKPLDPNLRQIRGDMVKFFDGVRRSS
jgi:hypothetical protein